MDQRSGGGDGEHAAHGCLLRPAGVADIDDIARIWHDGWRDGHLGHVPDGLIAHRAPEAFAARVPERVAATTVAVVDGVVVGFATLADDELEQLYVTAASRGSGAADRLIDHAEAAIGAWHLVAWLAVVAGNARARRFYERHGWSDAGEFDYEAEAVGGTFVVPSRRYEKEVGR
ncbi:GNAT family N-acetyltransferase [Aquihabitans sp. G128]|uniref:GNAT family N-acetyltransferase n=1 Tax=Aquihabitans sp. G128 TaxID=2849779 RepID=UPI001C22B672|nr:GNAT family N-acetyltransferase [Aquihabitans sp. G128]QXC60371.1 GNAT family N-acetyltransferase [Aquihabitans sp. G128]